MDMDKRAGLMRGQTRPELVAAHRGVAMDSCLSLTITGTRLDMSNQSPVHVSDAAGAFVSKKFLQWSKFCSCHFHSFGFPEKALGHGWRFVTRHSMSLHECHLLMRPTKASARLAVMVGKGGPLGSAVILVI